MQITKNSKNPELQIAFKDQIASGKVFIYAMEETSNPLYTTLFVAQRKNSGNINALDQMFLGWGNTITRAIRNADTTKVQELGLKVGQIIEGTTIQVVESHTPFVKEDKEGNVVYTSKALVNPTTGLEIQVNGKPIHRDTTLVMEEECKDYIISRTQVQQSVSLKANESFAKV